MKEEDRGSGEAAVGIWASSAKVVVAGWGKEDKTAALKGGRGVEVGVVVRREGTLAVRAGLAISRIRALPELCPPPQPIHPLLRCQ